MKRFKKAGDIKVGVVGYGGAFNMGKAHLMQMQRAGMTPAAVCEIDKSRLKIAEEDFPGILTYTRLPDMLKKSGVNLAVIITPHNTHAKLALQCLKAGCSVVCEKPLAITTAECDAMIREARKRRLVLSTYHNRHWDGIILQGNKLVRQGKIGEVVRIEAHMGAWHQPRDWWRSSRSISGGALYDWGVHLLEYSLQIIDSDITEVSGFAKSGYWKTKWKNDTIEDEGFAVVRFKSGQWLTLRITAIDHNPPPSVLEITGTGGTLSLTHQNWELVTTRKNGDKVVTRGKNPDGEQHKYYQNVADHMVKGEKLVITPEWSRRPIHILDLAVRSIKQGGAQKAKYK